MALTRISVSFPCATTSPWLPGCAVQEKVTVLEVGKVTAVAAGTVSNWKGPTSTSLMSSSAGSVISQAT
jgi:hypothetical protein